MPSLKRTLLAIAAFAALTVLPTAAQAQNAFTYFNTTYPAGSQPGAGQLIVQPAGSFTFGYTNPPATPLASTPFIPFDAGCGPSLSCGTSTVSRLFSTDPQFNGLTVPAVRTTTGSVAGAPDASTGGPPVYTGPGNTHAPYLVMNPGADLDGPGDLSGANTVVRFNATAGGSYNFTGFFQAHRATTNAFYSILVNGVTLAAGVVPNPGVIVGPAGTFPFSFNVFGLAPNSAVDFVVNFSPGDSQTNDVRFDVDVSAVPEPGTMLLLGISVLGLGGYAIKRRKAGGGDEPLTDEACA